MLERRKYRRYRLRRRVELDLLGTVAGRGPDLPANPASIPGLLVDISCGGVQALFAEGIDVGARCRVRIHDEDDGTVQHVVGRVRGAHPRSEGSLLSIEFTQPIVSLGDPGPHDGTGFDDTLRATALVVDDEPDVCHVLRRFLTTRGYRTAPAHDALQARAAIPREHPALMLLDLRLPGMSGLELLEQMAAEGLAVPYVWAMSAYADDREVEAAFNLGASDFLMKPFDLEHLDRSLELLATVV